MAEIDFDSVTKVFAGGKPAVDELSLHINDGEFMVLVGPSGCGKTTALRMLAGLEEITSGTLKIGGSVVNNTLPKDRDVAMVFQNYALYPHMSGRRTSASHSRFAAIPRARSNAKLMRRPRFFDSRTISIAVRRRSRVDSASESPWDGPSSAVPKRS